MSSMKVYMFFFYILFECVKVLLEKLSRDEINEGV